MCCKWFISYTAVLATVGEVCLLQLQLGCRLLGELSLTGSLSIFFPCTKTRHLFPFSFTVHLHKSQSNALTYNSLQTLANFKNTSSKNSGLFAVFAVVAA